MQKGAATTVSTASPDNADSATCSRCGATYKTGTVHICPLADPSTLTEDKLIGTTIDNRYTVEGRLGEGGMGVVYRARHVTLRKPVAIKVLRKAQEESAWKRFIQEAQTASMINHTNVVDLTDFGMIEGHPYLVMEFLEGETLTEAITSGPIPPLRVCRIGAQIARGLQAVHDKGIVHREVLMIDSDCLRSCGKSLQRRRQDYDKLQTV
jgi:serine/threonine-protein kinase